MKFLLENWREFLKTLTRPKAFWGSGGAGVLPIALSTGRILIGLRSSRVREPLTWGIIGGKIDPDESGNLEGAAKREFEEETGAVFKGSLIPIYKFIASNGEFTYQNYIGVVAEEFAPTTDWETAQFKWVTFEDLINIEPKHFGLKAVLNDSRSVEALHAVVEKLATEENNETPT